MNSPFHKGTLLWNTLGMEVLKANSVERFVSSLRTIIQYTRRFFEVLYCNYIQFMCFILYTGVNLYLIVITL